jgi:hypothetical protein
MKDGEREVRSAKCGEGIMGHSGIFGIWNYPTESLDEYPIYTRTETSMKSPEEIKKAISDYEFILDNQGYGSYEEKLEIEGKINLLTWVLGEESV